MAKVSMINRELKRAKTVKKCAASDCSKGANSRFVIVRRRALGRADEITKAAPQCKPM